MVLDLCVYRTFSNVRFTYVSRTVNVRCTFCCVTQKLFKWGEIIWTFEFVDFLVTSILIGERSEPENFVENEHFMRQFPW